MTSKTWKWHPETGWEITEGDPVPTRAELLGQVGYALLEGKSIEAASLAEQLRQMRRASLPDDEWDPRIDSGGRHSDDPDFGKELPSLVGAYLVAAAMFLLGFLVGMAYPR